MIFLLLKAMMLALVIQVWYCKYFRCQYFFENIDDRKCQLMMQWIYFYLNCSPSNNLFHSGKQSNSDNLVCPEVQNLPFEEHQSNPKGLFKKRTGGWEGELKILAKRQIKYTSLLNECKNIVKLSLRDYSQCVI